MLRKIALAAVIVLATGTLFAADECKKGTFLGSYTRADLNRDIFGDGTVIHSFATQLTLHTDGSAILSFTGFPDYLLTIGTGSTQVGSWTCRPDGKLVVNLIGSTYTPETVGAITDLVLQFSTRDSYLFTITDANTLTRTAFRRRRYTPQQDLTDPSAGTLLAPVTTTPVYKRVIASDADLLLP